jgi:hypothetical protein
MSGNTNNTVFIQRLFSSRDNFVSGNVEEAIANTANFVGDEGRIWWDPERNNFYSSDGNTPGGILIGTGGGDTYSNANVANYLAVYTGNINGGNIEITNTANLGNFTIFDQTLAGTVTDRTIRLSPVGNAAVQVLNGIQVYQGEFVGNPLFSVTNDGVVSTLVPNAVSYLGAFEIVGNPAGDTVPPQNYGVMLHSTGVQNTPSRYYNDGVNNYGAFINRRYNGTSASPTGVLANQIVGRLGATPYLIDDAWPSISSTRLDFVTTEDQTTTQQGSQIQLWATPDGETSPVIVAQFDPSEILLTGNLIPNSTSSVYGLGNATNKWSSLYLGPDSLFMEDNVLGTNAELTVSDGVLYINGTQRIQIGNMQMTTSGIQKIEGQSAEDLTIGTTGGGNTYIRNFGIKFKDDTIQETAAIPLSQRANAGGVATLGLDGIVPADQLPGGGAVYKGTWNADTNTPTLADGSGSGGDEYAVVVAGTQNLGSGSITFAVGDFVIYNGTIWQKIPSGGSGVTSFNTRTGAVTLTSSDVTTALTNGSITNAKLANANITINTGFGLGGGGVVNLGGSLSLTTSVGNILPGTGVGVSAASGNYTISIGQPVGTANSVQFLAVSASTTIQATGNISGGNVTTGGRVVALGNIETSGYLKTANTLINSGITSNGNVTFSGANVDLGSVANLHISGGNVGDRLRTDGAGNLSWVAPAGNTNTYVGANTTVDIDFTYDSISLVYLPTGPVTINLSNYSAGHTAIVIARFATPYTINLGIANAQQCTDGTTTLPTSGAGGHKITANRAVQLLYTCVDSTAANCYVAATFL